MAILFLTLSAGKGKAYFGDTSLTMLKYKTIHDLDWDLAKKS